MKTQVFILKKKTLFVFQLFLVAMLGLTMFYNLFLINWAWFLTDGYHLQRRAIFSKVSEVFSGVFPGLDPGGMLAAQLAMDPFLVQLERVVIGPLH